MLCFSSAKPIYLQLDNRYLELFDLNNSNEINNELSIEGISNNLSYPIIRELEDTHFIYLSNTFDNRYNGYIKMGMSDLSTIGLIKNDDSINSEGFAEIRRDINSDYFYSEFNKQINFITKYKEKYNKYIPFELPNRVLVYFSNFDTIKSEISKRIDDNEISLKLEIIFNRFNDDSLSRENIFKYNIARRLLIMLLNDCKCSVNPPSTT